MLFWRSQNQLFYLSNSISNLVIVCRRGQRLQVVHETLVRGVSCPMVPHIHGEASVPLSLSGPVLRFQPCEVIYLATLLTLVPQLRPLTPFNRLNIALTNILCICNELFQMVKMLPPSLGPIVLIQISSNLLLLRTLKANHIIDNMTLESRDFSI